MLRQNSFVKLAAGVTASEPANPKDLGSYACRDIMRLSGEDREIALALAHGYMLGKQNTTRFDTDTMARTTDAFIDYCLDHPAENALTSFEHASGSSEAAK